VIYLIDTAKGSIAYHIALSSSAGVCNVKATITFMRISPASGKARDIVSSLLNFMKAARLTAKLKGKPHEISVNTFDVNGS
jgi:hypothetical protein